MRSAHLPHETTSGSKQRATVPKVCGADVEFANFIAGAEQAAGTGPEASRALLREIDGVASVEPYARGGPDPHVGSYARASSDDHADAGSYARGRSDDPAGSHARGRSDDPAGSHARGSSDAGPDAGPYARTGSHPHVASGPQSGSGPHLAADTRSGSRDSYDGWDNRSFAAPGWAGAGRYGSEQDWGRRFLRSNGGCFYIDLDHLEGCLPEVTSAFDHVAAWHAMLRHVRQARARANARCRDGRTIEVLANNSDGRSNSYGSHLNFLITRRAWDDIFHRRLHYLGLLAAFQASSIVITGQGKVGAENGAPAVPYQISQRADFFETLAGVQTTYHRPLVNSRDEPLCGPADRGGAGGLARLHCIFYDSTLAHVASFLKVGMMQIVLAMIEAEQVNTRLLLDDPLDAVRRWSHDPTLRARAAMVSGPPLTAVELQARFLEDATAFVAAGGCEGIVPQATDILHWWEDTLLKLQAGDLHALASRLDWVLKLHILQQARERRPDLTWESPELKLLDHLYSSVAPDGLYWSYDEAGLVERIVDEARVAYFLDDPPEDTRAWTRAMVLRRADRAAIEAVDWDGIVFRDGWSGHQRLGRRLDLPTPFAFTRAETEHAFRDGASLDELLDALGAPRAEARDTVIPERIYLLQ